MDPAPIISTARFSFYSRTPYCYGYKSGICSIFCFIYTFCEDQRLSVLNIRKFKVNLSHLPPANTEQQSPSCLQQLPGIRNSSVYFINFSLVQRHVKIQENRLNLTQFSIILLVLCVSDFQK
jgi:hypothetical protein